MRNFSMKKFGTPIAAAPGCAREKVGLLGVGDPSGFVVLAFGWAFFFLGCVLVLQGGGDFGCWARWPTALSCAARIGTDLRDVCVVATQRVPGRVGGCGGRRRVLRDAGRDRTTERAGHEPGRDQADDQTAGVHVRGPIALGGAAGWILGSMRSRRPIRTSARRC